MDQLRIKNWELCKYVVASNILIKKLSVWTSKTILQEILRYICILLYVWGVNFQIDKCSEELIEYNYKHGKRKVFMSILIIKVISSENQLALCEIAVIREDIKSWYIYIYIYIYIPLFNRWPRKCVKGDCKITVLVLS